MLFRSLWPGMRHNPSSLWDCDNYVRLIGGRNLVQDEQRLTLLTCCLEDPFQWNVNRRLRSGELVTFNQFWAELEAEFGTGSGVGNRQNWESLTLKLDGSLTLPVFRQFWEKFLMLRSAVSGVTDEEAYRVLMGALPLKDREKALLEQKRMVSHKKVALLEGWPMVGHEAMLQWLHANGIWPRAVKDVPLGFEVEIHSEEVFYKLMNVNGHFFHGSPTPLRVTGLAISERFTTEEVANLMKGWLKDKESSQEFDRPNSSSKSFATPTSPWNSETRVFEVEANPGEQELALMAEHFELQVSQVDKFQKPRPTPVSVPRGNNKNVDTSEKGKGGAPWPKPPGKS